MKDRTNNPVVFHCVAVAAYKELLSLNSYRGQAPLERMADDWGVRENERFRMWKEAYDKQTHES